MVATGITPRAPAIPGVDHPKVVGYVDVLAGRAKVGQNVAIIGMGGIGFDVALYLLERDSRAPLDAAAFSAHWGISADGASADISPSESRKHRITMLKRSTTPFGHTLGRTTGWVHRAELARNGVKMLKGVEYRRIDDAGVHVIVDGKEMRHPGRYGDRLRRPGAEPGIRRAHLIGGAKEAGELDAKRAMLEGAELAARL